MEKVNILGINCSPRPNGNSQFLLKGALDYAREFAPDVVQTELYKIAGKTYNPCDGCNQCHERLGYCRQTDDDFAELRDKWLAADVILYSIPIFHIGVPGQVKCFIDRLGNSVVEGFNSRLLKVVGVITQGTGMSTGQEYVMQFINGHATMQGCIPVGGIWPGGYLGVGTWTRCDVSKDALRNAFKAQDPDLLKTLNAIKELSKHMIQLTQILKAGGRVMKQTLKEDGGFEFFLRQLEDE
jgi:multimeric flavodoxin WrbA